MSSIKPDHAPVDPDRSPIFLIGTGRSGTTLLRQILNAHPRIYLTNEAFFYTYERMTHRSVSGSEWLERFFDTFSFAWLRIAPDEVRAVLPASLPRERVFEAFRAIMKIKAAHQGKVRYGEKSPLDTANLGRIFRDFPEARVIYITRDPRATVVSYTRMPWGSSSLTLSSFACRQQLERTAPNFERIHELRLEDLLASPRSELSKILDFVGELWDDAVLDHIRHSPIDDVAPFPWFISATNKKLQAPAGPPLWQRVLSPTWIRIIEQDNKLGMHRYGYLPAPLDREPSAAERLGARLADGPEAIRTIVRWMRAANDIWNWRRRGGRGINPQRSMEAHLKSNPRAWQHYPDFTMPQVPEAAAEERV